ncbi:MAG TPA: DNA polymerase III subunit delta [Solirubrobacteraceae bacterium]|nr:DNA polymerase III subunit delta [Solirubrobacteraceae bacterium]
MAELKPAYLIHGDDHGAVAERRAGLRALAEAPGAEAAVELLEGDDATPAGVAAALSAMTLAVGQRVIVVEGVERWREADVEQQLAPLMAAMPPETTLALFAREEARAKAPAALHGAVKQAGGQVVAQMTVKPWELPKWAREQAARLGISLDAAAAKALVAQVGERQQRLLRELEKLALEGDSDGAGRTVTVDEIEARAAHSAEFRAFALADALVGADGSEATLSYLRVRGQGERLSGLIYLMSSRLRDALAAALRLQAGESAANVKRSLRMPSRAADRFLADVEHSDPAKLRAALGLIADLELNSRGGALIAAERDPLAALDEDTLAVRAIREIAA